MYAKAVVSGKGELELSPEEAQAVEVAISQSAGPGAAAEQTA